MTELELILAGDDSCREQNWCSRCTAAGNFRHAFCQRGQPCSSHMGAAHPRIPARGKRIRIGDGDQNFHRLSDSLLFFQADLEERQIVWLGCEEVHHAFWSKLGCLQDGRASTYRHVWQPLPPRGCSSLTPLPPGRCMSTGDCGYLVDQLLWSSLTLCPCYFW